jgi:hypothetical protein|nr:MAG TPA: hypothetical protein [Caudoviricetes sp.]
MIKELTFTQEGNNYTTSFKAEKRELAIYIKVDPEGKRAVVELFTSIDNTDFAFRDFLIDDLEDMSIVTREIGISGIIRGQYIKIVSNSPVLKCKILYED